MGTYITEASVRRTVGIDSSEISNADVDSTITEVEKQVPRKFNTVFVPTERIDILNGDGTNRLLLDMNPVLSVRALKIDGTSEDPENLEIYKESGYIFLGAGADTSKFSNKRRSNVVKYLYGSVVYSETNTTTDDDEVVGTSVVIGVSDASSFTQNDWVEIYGMDGNKEVAQISSITSNNITIDELVQDHESGSTIVKMEVDTNFTKYMNLVGAIALIARIIGQSYKDTVGYDLGELHVQKGEPYTQWREAANQFIHERDFLAKTLTIRPRVVML